MSHLTGETVYILNPVIILLCIVIRLHEKKGKKSKCLLAGFLVTRLWLTQRGKPCRERFWQFRNLPSKPAFLKSWKCSIYGLMAWWIRCDGKNGLSKVFLNFLYTCEYIDHVYVHYIMSISDFFEPISDISVGFKIGRIIGQKIHSTHFS